MRVCSPELGVAPGANSGGEVHDREILTALGRRGVELEILLPAGRPVDTSVPNWRVERLPVQHIVPPYLFNLLIQPYLERTYRARPFELLRVHSPYFVGLGALAFRQRHPEVPLVATYHHVEPSVLYDVIDRRWASAWDRVIAVSDFTKQQLCRRFGLPADRVVVIHNGVDERFAPRPKSADLVETFGLAGRDVLLYLGGLKRRKNLSFLLEVLRTITDPRVVLVIAGDGPEGRSLRARAAALGLRERVRFTGRVSEEAKRDWYATADLFVFPSAREGFGMVAAEALACGTAVLVPRALAFAEFVRDGEGGRLLPPNDVAAWRAAVIELLANPTERRVLADRGRARIQREFTWQRAAERHEVVYRDAIAARRGSRAVTER